MSVRVSGYRWKNDFTVGTHQRCSLVYRVFRFTHERPGNVSFRRLGIIRFFSRSQFVLTLTRLTSGRECHGLVLWFRDPFRRQFKESMFVVVDSCLVNNSLWRIVREIKEPYVHFSTKLIPFLPTGVITLGFLIWLFENVRSLWVLFHVK